MSDHMSFLMREEEAKESILFSGDIILGTPSTVVEDLHVYMDTLRMLRDTKQYQCDKICVPHSVGFDEEDSSSVIMDAESKLLDYIKYREDRLL